MLLAQSFLLLTALYTAIGVVVAVLFSARGVFRVDASARGSHPAFHLLILPGAAALWPLVLTWWARAPKRPVNAHAAGPHA
ncbi:MAG: hypothetical protein IT436_12830 [Phycisphaerales bacterium]|nr:hypothetical protein [Phycisphaerales bacterium]